MPRSRTMVEENEASTHPILKPTDRCCQCFGGRHGACAGTQLCGPPIWRAARCLCIYYIFVEFQTFVSSCLMLSADECYIRNARRTLLSATAIHLLNVILFAWGARVCGERQAVMSVTLFRWSCIVQLASVLVRYCMFAELDKSPRELSVELEERCYLECLSSAPTRYNTQSTEYLCSASSRVSFPFQDYLNLVYNLCIYMYFQYILWSFMQKCKDGTVDHGDTFLVVPLPASSLHHHGNRHNQSGVHQSSEGGQQSEDNVPMAIPVRVGVPVTGISAPSSGGEGQGGYSIGAAPPPSFAPSAYNPASGPGEWRGGDRYRGGGAIPAAWGAAPPANASGFVMAASAPVMTEDVIPRAEAVPVAQTSLR